MLRRFILRHSVVALEAEHLGGAFLVAVDLAEGGLDRLASASSTTSCSERERRRARGCWTPSDRDDVVATITPAPASATPCSIMFSSSRMLPGKS